MSARTTEVNHEELKKILMQAAQNQEKTPIIISGNVGIGKSAVVMDFAKEWSKMLEKEGVRGIAWVGDQGYGLKEHLSILVINLEHMTGIDLERSELFKVSEEGYGVLLFRNLESATKDVRERALKLMRERELTGVFAKARVPDKWIVVGTVNTNIEPLEKVIEPAALSDFKAYHLNPPTKDEWIKYNMTHETSHPLVSKFVAEFPKDTRIYDFDPSNLHERRLTPRALSLLAKKLNMLETAGVDQRSADYLKSVRMEAEAALGTVWAKKFVEFCRKTLEEAEAKTSQRRKVSV